MKGLKQTSTSAGYNQEELYFFKREQELIEKAKRKAKLELIQGGKSTGQANSEAANDSEETDEKKTA